MLTEDEYSLVLRYVRGIPKQLLYIFLPTDEEGLILLEANLLARAIGKRDRRDVFSICKQYNLPVKCRRESGRYLRTIAKLNERRKRLDNRWRDNNEGGVL